MTLVNSPNFTTTTESDLQNDTDFSTAQVFNFTEPAGIRSWNMAERAVFGTWLTLSMLCAVVGNLMVIVVVMRHKGMQTRTNMFLVNLAIADFLVGILLAPFSLTTLISEKWLFGEIMCNINGFMNAVCFITSIHTLMYISIHKYVSITRPFSRILNRWKILVMSAAAWLWAIICALLTLLLNKVVFKPGAMQCGPEYPRNNKEYLHHVIISGSNIVIPLIVVTFAYARMYCEFTNHAQRLHENTTLQTDQILAQQVQVTKTLFIVLACFMLCWLPYFTYSSYVSTIKDKSNILAWSNPAAYCFMYMNSGCNPIIYAWRSPSFREGYKQILCQQSGYIVSDDTIRDSDSPGIIRRLSIMLHSSFRTTRLSTRRTSEDGLSLTSVHMSRKTSVSSPSHTLLRRATSKTAKGSSIIRKDGSVIITKNGKIISVRHDADSVRRDRSFSGFEDMKARQTNGVSRSYSERNIIDKDRVDLIPLLKIRNSVSRSPLSSNENVNSKFGHTSLTKIDSVDETEIESLGNKLLPPERQLSSHSQSLTLLPREGSSAPILPQRNKSNSSSVKSDLDDVFIQSPVRITYNSQEGMLNAMPLQPTIKAQVKLAKSDMQLNIDISASASNKAGSNALSPSKSSNVVSKVPLMRYPSVEKLDVQFGIPRCSSDASTIRKLLPRSPLYVRRWLSNKNVDQTEKSKT